MSKNASPVRKVLPRAFKTVWFARAARKRGILDAELYQAWQETSAGQAVNLGGGVWKKRLNENQDRSIILAKGGERWFFVYLFMKKDRANIDSRDLDGFKKLASEYAQLSVERMQSMLESGDLVEICNAD